MSKKWDQIDKPSWRFVVAVDVPGETLAEAYARMRGALHPIDGHWESTDEAYYPDGEEVDLEDLELVRKQALWRLGYRP